MLQIHIKKKLVKFSLSFDLDIDCQGITAILGISGSGKSSLINLINGLSKPDSGHIHLNQNCFVNTKNSLFIPAQNRDIATIFQDPLLFPHYKVIKNLTYGTKAKNHPKFDEIVDVLNISTLLERYPFSLSGGEKQRVAIGRALLNQPKLLLMDEPFSALDMPRKNELIDYILKLNHQTNIPIIYVTHNLHEVKKLADQVAIIDQGRCYAYGKTQTLLNCDYLKTWI